MVGFALNIDPPDGSDGAPKGLLAEALAPSVLPNKLDLGCYCPKITPPVPSLPEVY